MLVGLKGVLGVDRDESGWSKWEMGWCLKVSGVVGSMRNERGWFV